MDTSNFTPASETEVYNYLSELRSITPIGDDYLAIYASYILHLHKEHDSEGKLKLSELLDGWCPNDSNGFLEDVLKDAISESLYEALLKIAPKVSLQTLKTVILDTAGKYAKVPPFATTPDTLTDLVLRLFDLHDGDQVFDICGGVGNFITRALLHPVARAHYSSSEINPETHAVMTIRAEIMDPGNMYHDIDFGNSFVRAIEGEDEAMTKDLDETYSYDKVFGNYPWMPSGTFFRDDWNSLYASEVEKVIPGISSRTSSDWIFNYFMVELMKKKTGRAIGIMTNGSTWNMSAGCRRARQYFLEHGLVEAVIALPPRVFKGTNIATTLIIFSYGNNKVRMVDATTMCTEVMKQSTFTANDIEQIVQAYHTDGMYSKLVDAQEIIDEYDTVIHPSRFLAKEKPVKDGKPLGQVLKAAWRGAAISAKELDSLYTDSPTATQYVKLQNINDGMIDEDIPYLSGLDDKYEKFCAPNHALLLSKIGNPFKCAVAEVKPGHKLLVTGNLFILEMDESKVNPYYLKALFESSYGRGLLSSIQIGSVINTINKGALEKLVVPIPTLEKQNQIVSEYLAIQDEIKIYRKKLADAVDRKSHIFDIMQED